MGQKEKKKNRVVLDTNVLVSALLFPGKLARLTDLWHEGKITPVICKDTFAELQTVLEYPKFSLSPDEIQALIAEEILPYCEVVEVQERIQGVCRDPEDDKFLACALAAAAEFLVSGDRDLTDLKRHKKIRIVAPSQFLRMFA